MHLSHQLAQRLSVTGRMKFGIMNVSELDAVRIVATAEPIHFTIAERAAAVKEDLDFKRH